MRLTRDTYGACFVRVYLNGERVNLCTSADDDAGEVICHMRDAFGQIIRDGDAALQFKRTGRVAFRLVAGAPARAKELFPSLGWDDEPVRSIIPDILPPGTEWKPFAE